MPVPPSAKMKGRAVEKSVPVDNEPVPPLPLYSTSSQYKHWRYSKSGLEKIRDELNEVAIGRVQKMVEEDRNQQTSSAFASTSTLPSPVIPRSTSPTPVPSPSEIQYLTSLDELSLVTYYLSGISEICRGLKFPEMVEASATTYLKRFYLRNTVMDYHPKNVMLTSIFLATKTENHYMTIHKFASMLKATPEDVLALEFLVSQSLRFEYKVHHAHLAGYGLSLDLQTTSESSAESIAETYRKAQLHLRSSRLTDVEFIYTPSQIALACFYMVDPLLVSNWLIAKAALTPTITGSTPSSSLKNESADQKAVLKMLDAIAQEIHDVEENKVSLDVVREIDKRLKWTHNPEKDPSSALFKKRKAEAEIESREKAAVKAAKRGESTYNAKLEDIFN